MNSKCLKNLNAKTSNYKIPRKKSGESPNIGFGNNFLDMTLKAQVAREKKKDKMSFIKLKNFCAAKAPPYQQNEKEIHCQVAMIECIYASSFGKGISFEYMVP